MGEQLEEVAAIDPGPTPGAMNIMIRLAIERRHCDSWIKGRVLTHANSRGTFVPSDAWPFAGGAFTVQFDVLTIQIVRGSVPILRISFQTTLRIAGSLLKALLAIKRRAASQIAV